MITDPSYLTPDQIKHLSDEDLDWVLSEEYTGDMHYGIPRGEITWLHFGHCLENQTCVVLTAVAEKMKRMLNK